MARSMYRRVTRSELQFKRLQHGDQKQVFAGLLWMAQQKGHKRGWAAYRFKAIYGEFPSFNQREIEPSQPPSDLLTWLERDKRNWQQREKRARIKRQLDNKNASALALARINAILAELEANPLAKEPCCQEDSDGEALDIVSRICAKRAAVPDGAP